MPDLSIQGIADIYLAHVNPISVLFLIAAFCGVWWKVGKGKSASDTRKELGTILFAPLSIASLPTGVALLICAIDPSLLPKIQGLFMQIGLAGLIVIFEGVTAIREQW